MGNPSGDFPAWEGLDGPSGLLQIYRSQGGADHRGTLLLVHDLPLERASAANEGNELPYLADRICSQTRWHVESVRLRGVGGSEGDFSPEGWMEDLAFAVDWLASRDNGRVWAAGFGFGVAVLLAVSSADDRVAGIACLGPDLRTDYLRDDPPSSVALLRASGVIRHDGFPPDLAAWAKGFDRLSGRISAGIAAAAGQGRDMLVVHGADDRSNPPEAARSLAEASAGGAAAHLLHGAGRRLQADPRAAALLVGWLERQVV